MDFFTPENLIALLTLTSLEIVLGIDNIVFLSILSGKLPEAQQKKARQIGLLLAMGMRILLLLAISWVMGLTEELFTVLGHTFTGKDLILLGGGLFLVSKATFEIHDKVEGRSHEVLGQKVHASMGSVLLQIVVLDLVFSLDSVITAVGMAKNVNVMIAAVVIAVIVMMIFAGPVATFVERHPTMKILALAFLILVGVLLIADGFHVHLPRGYVYTAMAFSLVVELLNLRMRSRAARKKAAEGGTG